MSDRLPARLKQLKFVIAQGTTLAMNMEDGIEAYAASEIDYAVIVA